MEDSKSEHKNIDPIAKNVELFIKLVNGVGFPIVACLGLFYLLNGFTTDVISQLKAINSNLIALNKVVGKHEADIYNLRQYHVAPLDTLALTPYNKMSKLKNKEVVNSWQENLQMNKDGEQKKTQEHLKEQQR